MLDEGSGAMEKKLPPRQSPAQPKNNGVISEKKSEFASNRNGRQRKFKQPNNGGRSQELSQNPKPLQKYTQYYGDKRPRQRGYFNDRQGEEVVDVQEDLFVADDTNSRKGNANYLLKFSFAPRGENGQYESGRGVSGRFGRGGYGARRRTVTQRYSPEQFLQASCQFIVTEGGEYTEQAINPDALVNWDMVEQVRTFNVEPVVCPICLQEPCAGKITKCGHVYCWSCILHHLQEKEMMCRKLECPICPHRIDPEELKSVLCVETRDFKVGDLIEMKLMRKSKGSVYVCPKSEWKDKEGIPHNIDDGTVTQYMKLLSATCSQVQERVINREKADLDEMLEKAEGYEISYIQLARDYLEKRETRLLTKNLLQQSVTDSEKHRTLSDTSYDSGKLYAEDSVSEEAFSNSTEHMEGTVTYADAFEDKEELPSISPPDPGFPEAECYEAALPGDDDTAQPAPPFGQVEGTELLADQPSSCPNSPALTLSLLNQQFCPSGHLTPEEAADHLELPEGSGGHYSFQRDFIRNKDSYYFYQASTGQHIYLSSLNAQCLTKEYGSLENSPEVLEAQIVAIERIFMNEDVRKRLRYLNHIPLTCEFHVVELKLQPPLVSRETLQHFQPEFDKRRRARLKKKKEEKDRARQQEMEHKASFGIFPEVQIPLDNLTQFPAHLGNSVSTGSLVTMVGGTMQNEFGLVRGERLSGSSSETSTIGADSSGSQRQRNDSEDSQTGQVSFAQMLKAGKSVPPRAVWGRAAPQDSLLHASPSMQELSSPPGTHSPAGNDDDGGECLPAPPISVSWLAGMDELLDAHNNQHQAQEESAEGPPEAGGRKKKKKKGKQLLFSTSMARKG